MSAHHASHGGGPGSGVATWLRSPEVYEALAAWVLGGDDYVVLLDDDLKVVDANGSFLTTVCMGAAPEPPGFGFAETLAEASRASFLALVGEVSRGGGSPAGEGVVLFHAESGATRSVRYSVLRCGPHWLLVGRDESKREEMTRQTDVPGEEAVAAAPSGGTERVNGRVEGAPPLLDGPTLARVTEEYVQRLRTDAERFSLIALDIDNFREVNDVHGYPTGDQVIERVAQVLRENIRENDAVARVGGEEFMVLLPGLTGPEAVDVAERLRSAVELTKMPDQVRRITISLGVVSAKLGSFGTGSEATALAERALQQAKDGGRNCVRSME